MAQLSHSRRWTLAFLITLFAGAGCDSLTEPGPVPLVHRIAAGGSHSCAIRSDGVMLCWGRGDVGQLGQGSRAGSAVPVVVNGGFTWLEAELGRSHSCGLDSDSMLRCWGWNRYGQLGTGSFADLSNPGFVGGNHRFVDFDMGWDHSCGVNTESELLCWGRNDQGQLGDGTTVTRNLPDTVAIEASFAEVATGGFHSCGLTADGRAYCWGLNHLGQLGDGTSRSSRVPVAVIGGQRFSSITAGYTHTCGIAPGGQAYCWGSNEHGELGNGGLVDVGSPGALLPTPVTQSERVFQAIAGGLFYTCAIDPARGTFCWGRGIHGQIGTAGPFDRTVPQALHTANDSRFRQISAGAGIHACGVSVDDLPYCWGESPDGQLGNPSTSFSDVPVTVDGLGGS